MNRSEFGILIHEELGTSLTTMDCRCVKEDQIGRISVVPTVDIRCWIWGVEPLTKVTGRRHPHELRSVLKSLPNLINWQPTEEGTHSFDVNRSWLCDARSTSGETFLNIVRRNVVFLGVIGHTLVNVPAIIFVEKIIIPVNRICWVTAVVFAFGHINSEDTAVSIPIETLPMVGARALIGINERGVWFVASDGDVPNVDEENDVRGINIL